MLAHMSAANRLVRRLQGPLPALPTAVDRWCERWWRLPPRVRVLLILLLLAVALIAGEARVARAQRRWGGPPRRALIAVADAHVGAKPDLRQALLPPAMVPPHALQTVAPDTRLALALPEGTVLTRAHVSPRGPAVGLDPGVRVVPLPVQPGLDIHPGGSVDVWVLAAAPGRSRRVAQRRPVVGVTTTDDDEATALVGLATGEVGATMRGLADGQVLLTQAPP